jgi:hypothetical protein
MAFAPQTVLTAAALNAALTANLTSQTFTNTTLAGTTTGVTVSPGDNTTNVATTAFVTAATTAATSPVNVVGRNKVHNPLMVIAQRGTGPFTANGAYTVDRWFLGLNTDTNSVSQVSLSDANRTSIGDEEALYGLRNVFTGTAGAGAYSQVVQRIEGVHRLSNKTVTVSFWAFAASGSLSLGASLDQNFGSGGSPSATVNGTGAKVTVSTTPTRYSMTFSLPSTASTTLGTTANTDYTQLNLWYSSGATNAGRAGSVGVQSGTLTIWGVQLEIAAAATQLEKLDITLQMAQCQRYYRIDLSYIISGYNTTGHTSYASLIFSVLMRGIPSVTFANPNLNNAPALTVQNAFAGSLLLQTTITATGVFYAQGDVLSSADL